MRVSFSRWHPDERGIAGTVLIVSLVFILALVALVIDGGNLFLHRRQVVAAADSGALAAAQSMVHAPNAACDTAYAPAQSAADQTAAGNISGPTRIYYQCVSQTYGGTPVSGIRVGYQATVNGLFSSNRVVSAGSTAVWGPAGAASGLLPIGLDGSLVEGACGVPQPTQGTPCNFWFANNNTSSQWGWLSLCSQDAANNGACPQSKVGWNVGSAASGCPNSGGLGNNVITGGFPYLLTMAAPPPTYVCIDSGAGTNDWNLLAVPSIGVFPVRDPNPASTILRNGQPYKYAIIGLTAMEILFVGRGNSAVPQCGPVPQWISNPQNGFCIHSQWIGPQEVNGTIGGGGTNLGSYAIALGG